MNLDSFIAVQKSLFGGFFYERGREAAEHHGLFRVSLTETESRTQLSYFSAIVRAHRGGVCHGQGNDTQARGARDPLPYM